LWAEKNWILHHDNAPLHSALTVCEFFAKNDMITMDHHFYLPDLAPCDFFVWILHHDNAPLHSALTVCEFFTKNDMITMDHLFYLPDLAPCDFFVPQSENDYVG
jgi:hypothetical protein